MAKAKKGKGKKKSGGLAVIGGVKVPKELRGFAAQAAKLGDNPVIADIVAAGLVAAAGALMAEEPIRKAAKAVGEGAEEAGEEAVRSTSRASAAVRAAAGAMGREVVETIKAAATGKTRTRGKSAAKAVDGQAEG